MKQAIEDTLRPATLNEVLLIERIRELHRIMWDKGDRLNPWDVDPNEKIRDIPYVDTSLRLATHFTASKENKPPYGLRIQTRSLGPTQFHYAHYVDGLTLESLPPHREAEMFDSIWRQGMHSLAKELRRITTDTSALYSARDAMESIGNQAEVDDIDEQLGR